MTSLEGMVDSDSWARIVDLFVDALPIAELGFTHSKLNKEGNLPYHPSDLFKLLLYGYRHGIRSANQLSNACTINVEVMCLPAEASAQAGLLKGLRPSPRTVNYFRANNTEAIEKAHRHFVGLLKNWKLIDGQVMAVDGTKVRGQNSLKNNFNAKKIRRHLEYIDGRIGDYLDQLEEAEEDPSRRKRKLVKELQTKIAEQEARREKYEALSEQVDQSEDGQVSLTDGDARAVIKHRNIVEVGYNIQTVADAKHKLVVDVFAGGVNDLNELGIAGERAQEISGVEKIDLLADAGYHNGTQLAKCERRGVRPFVAPRRGYPQKEEGFRKEDFVYDQDTDTYTCPAGSELTHTSTFKRKTSKVPYRVKRYTTPQCDGCPLRTQCTTSTNGRYIERPIHQAYTERNDRRVARYRDFYRTRQEIIEHIFGTWKRQWGMTHSVVKGKTKVKSEYRLAAIAYNLLRATQILGLKKLQEQLRSLFFVFLCLVWSTWRPKSARYLVFP